jgi:septal ring factor EnvC (AmiA/AmiB activator)
MDSGEPISLERKKLALEIADLERPWWKRPAYVLAALPTMLAFGTLLVGAFSGYFQAAYTKLENQRRDLEAQVKEFETKRDELHQKLTALENEKNELENQVTEGRNLQDYAHYQAYRTAKCEDELQKLKARQR